MKVSELTAFVDRKNAFSFGGKLLSLQSATDRQTIAELIDSELSPENLSCDGEVSMTEVRRKLKTLTKAGTQLLKLDPSVKMWELDVV
jgi:DNA-binding transcriptional ArsR family regulator